MLFIFVLISKIHTNKNRKKYTTNKGMSNFEDGGPRCTSQRNRILYFMEIHKIYNNLKMFKIGLTFYDAISDIVFGLYLGYLYGYMMIIMTIF